MNSKEEIKRIIRIALDEDISGGDITSDSLEFKKSPVGCSIIAKEQGVLCGTEIAAQVFREVSKDNKVEILKKDGSRTHADDVVVRVTGTPAELLKAERTALNFLSHLSGISTFTNRFVEIVRSQNPECTVLDTRKTLPGLRAIEKYAVRTGGGENHRFSLSEHVLIKENHLSVSGIGIKETVSSVRKKAARTAAVEVEVENIKQLKETLGTDIDIVMLDNFKVDDIIQAVKMVKDSNPGVKIEVSGGITLDNVAEVASAGVDRISVGRLTNSAPALDFSMLIK